MDAIAILLARPDAETLLYVMVGYLVPLLLYCVTATLAFLALARRPDAPGRTLAHGLVVLALPIVGALFVLGRSVRRAPSPTI